MGIITARNKFGCTNCSKTNCQELSFFHPIIVFGEISGHGQWLNELANFSNLATRALGKILEDLIISMPELRRWIKIQDNSIDSKGIATNLNRGRGTTPIMLVKRKSKKESLTEYPGNHPKPFSNWGNGAVEIGFKVLLGLLISSIFMHGCHAGTHEDEELKATIFPISQTLKP